MTDKEAIQYVISKVNNADEKGVELTEFDINKVETLISIINRQQAEIERLQGLLDGWKTESYKLSDSIDNIKSEAIKEFVEKLKEDLKSNNYIVSFDRIDNLVKEMVGEQK